MLLSFRIKEIDAEIDISGVGEGSWVTVIGLEALYLVGFPSLETFRTVFGPLLGTQNHMKEKECGGRRRVQIEEEYRQGYQRSSLCEALISKSLKKKKGFYLYMCLNYHFGIVTKNRTQS